MANRFEMVFKAIDKATAPIRKINKAIGGITGAAKSLAKIGLIGGSLGLAALSTGLTVGVTKAIAFESAMADVKKVVDFPTPDGFKNMGKDILDLSRNIPIAATGLAEIVAAAGQANIPREELLKFTEMAAKVGVAFDLPAGQVGDALAKMKTALKLTVGETGLLADAINHLSNNMASEAPQVLDFMSRVGSAGESYGFAKEATAAIGSAMIAAGAQADVAATSFRNVGKALTKGEAATKAQRNAFKALGLDAVNVAKSMQTDAVGTMVQVIEKIKALPKHVQASTISQLFGDEARAIMPLINNMDLLKQSIDHVSDATKFAGSAQDEYKTRSETTANAIQVMKNNLDAIGISIGSRLLPPLNEALIKITNFLKGIGDGTTGIEKAFSAVQAVWTDFFSAFSGNFDSISTAFAGAGTAATKLGDTISGVFSKFTGESETYGTTLGKAFGAGIELAINVVTKGMEIISATLKALEPAIQATVTFLGDVFKGMKNNFGPVAKVFSDMLASVGELGSAFGKLFDAITGGNGAAVGEFIGEVLVGSLQILLRIIQGVADVLAQMVDGIATFVNKAKEGFTSVSELWGKLSLFGGKSKPMTAEEAEAFYGGGAAKKATANVEKLTKANEALKAATKPVANDNVAPKPALNLEAAERQTRQVKAAQAAIITEADKVLQAVNTMVQSANAKLASVDWTVHGQRMMDTLAAGMKARAHVVVDQIKATMQEVRNHLPSSPAKVGPLSDIHKLKFGETIAQSIRSKPMVAAMRAATAATRAVANDNQFGVLEKAELSRDGGKAKNHIKAEAQRQARSTSSSAGNGGGGSTNGGGTTVNYSPTINIDGGGADAEKRFAEMLKEHSREIKKIVDGEGKREKRRSYG